MANMATTYNDTYLVDEEAIDPSLDPTTAQQLAKEYECHCFGATVINAPPRVVLAFVISIILVATVTVLIFTVGQVAIFAPILTAIVAFWLPSPLQQSMSRKDAANQAQLTQNNRWMKRAVTRYNSVFSQIDHLNLNLNPDHYNSNTRASPVRIFTLQQRPVTSDIIYTNLGKLYKLVCNVSGPVRILH